MTSSQHPDPAAQSGPKDLSTEVSEDHPVVPIIARPVPSVGIWVGPREEPARYERHEHVGGGAEGAVYRARFVGLGTTSTRVLALKEYRRPPGSARNWPHDGTWLRISDQAGLLHGLAYHPHLVSVQSVFLGAVSSSVTDRDPASTTKVFDTPFVVMEWIDGRSPAAEMAASPVSLQERLQWICHLASAIDLLHSVSRTGGNAIIHGDIKPGNCLITSGRGLVLVDTGALTRRDATGVHRGLCSPPYAAPEVLAAPGRARGVATDLFSLGAMAYLLVTGEPPPDASAPDYFESARERLGRERFNELPTERCEAIRAAILVYLDPEPTARERVNPLVWSAALRDLTSEPDRRPQFPSRFRLLTAAAVAILTIVAAGIAAPHLPFLADRSGEPSFPSHAPAIGDSNTVTSTDDFTVFGKQWAKFTASTDDSSLSITPPLGAHQYDHLWGFYLPRDNCAATVEFDARLIPLPAASNYGLAVAPRSLLVDDQPTGASVQYEWEGADVINQPGSYVRPADLPGGAWALKVSPAPAPDVRHEHRLRIDATGTTLKVSIDGRQLSEYAQASVECGGVAIRVWGAAASLTNIRITGT